MGSCAAGTSPGRPRRRRRWARPRGRALFAAWAGAGAARRARGAPTATLVTGSDDQTVRAWEVDDPSHSPAAEAEAAAREGGQGGEEARQGRGGAAGGREGERGRRRRPPRRGESGSGPAASTDTPREAGTDPAQAHPQGASSKKKRKGTGGRGIVKPPPGKARRRASRRGATPRCVWRGCWRGGPPRRLPASPRPARPSLWTTRAPGTARGDSVCTSGRKRPCVCCAWRSPPWRAATAPGEGFGNRRGGGRFRRPTPFRGGFLFRLSRKRGASPSRTRRRGGVVPRGLPYRLRVSVRGVRRTDSARFPRRARRRRARAVRLRRARAGGPTGSPRRAPARGCAPPVPARRPRGHRLAAQRGARSATPPRFAAARLLPIDPLLAETRVALAAAEETRGGAEGRRQGAPVRRAGRRGRARVGPASAGGARAAAEVALVMGARGEPEKSTR